MNRLTTARFLALVILAACSGKQEQKLQIQTAPIARRTIVLDASASGTVEPINVVEVKSKSSGQITKMTVETGTLVKPGDLLVQLDTRDVQNQYDQAQADLNAANAKMQVSEAQKKRADDLFKQRIITATENESAQLDYANSQAAVIRARTGLDLAKQRLEDATVKAPVAGTVIEKTVSLGQVIASATNSASGGTTLLKMADLTKVRMRALFNETDIGSVQPGQQATVIVDAYPDRPFRGAVEKIEPQAVVTQSVTMFPVLVNLANNEGLLKPGMNGEASVLVDRRENVLAVPNDAIRTTREAPILANQLGLNPDSVSAQVQAQMARSFTGSRSNGDPGSMPNFNSRPAGAPRSFPGEVDLPQGQGQFPQVTDQDCAAVRQAMAKKPDVAGKLQVLRQRMMNGEIDVQAMRTESQKLYGELGVDPRIAGACMRRDRGQQGGGQGAPAGTEKSASGRGTGNAGAAQQGGGSSARTGSQGGGRAGAAGRSDQQGAATPMPQGEFPSPRSRSRPGVVFVSDSGRFAPRVVRLGVGNFDYTEVLSGLKEGDQVALLGVAAIQAARDSSTARIRQMTGGGLPGMQKSQTQGGQGTTAPGGASRPKQ